MEGKCASAFDYRPKEESYIYLKIVTEEEKSIENPTLIEEIPFDSSEPGKVEFMASDTLCFVQPDHHEKVIFTRQTKEKISQDEWNGITTSKNSRFDISCSSKQNESSSRFPLPKIEGRKAPGANRVLPLITSVWEDNDIHRKRQKAPKIGLEKQHTKGKLSSTSRKHSQGNFNLEEENEEWLEKWDFDDLGGSIYRAYTDFFMSEEGGESREDCICSECGMEFLTATHVAYHLEVYHNKGAMKLHQCFVCRRKRYPSLIQLNQHLSEAHGIPRPQLTCRTCFMELVGESEAKAHSRKHQTPYKCPRCPLSQPQNGHSVSVPRFATQFLLSEHLREVHLPLERPFSCPICGRHFIHEFVRNLHFSRRHTNHSLVCPEVRQHFFSSSGLSISNDLPSNMPPDNPVRSNVNSLNVLKEQENCIEELCDSWKNTSHSKSFERDRFSFIATKKIFERLPDDCLDLQIVSQQKTVSCSRGNFMFPDDVSLLRHVFKCHEKEVRVQLLKWAKEVDREDTLFEKLWNSYLNTPKNSAAFKISLTEEVKNTLEPVNEVDMEVLINSGRISLSFQSPSRQAIDHHLDKMAENVYTGHDATIQLAHVINNPRGTSSSSTLLDTTNQSPQSSSKLLTDSVSSLNVACVNAKGPLESLIPAIESISDKIANVQPTYSCLLKPDSHPNPSEVPNESPVDWTEISESVKLCLTDIVKVVCDVFDEGSSVKDSKTILSQSSPQKAASVRCLLCRYLASSAMALERHRRRRHFRNKHCPFCSLACQSIEAVGRHVLHSHLNSSAKDANVIVSKEGSKEPEECQSQKMVQPSSGLRCPICKKIFSSRGKCNSHQETVHKMEVVSRPLQCDVCFKKFQFQKALERHQLLHGQDDVENGNQNLYSCPHCEQTFLRPGFLERHIASHFDSVDSVQKEGKGKVLSGTFGHLCKYCSRRLPTRAKLKAHVRTSHPPSHLRQRFICNQCPVKCNTASGLRVHMRVHTGERPYNCTECSMGFKRKTALRKHIATVHAPLTRSDADGVATFLQCSNCSSSFRDRSNLVRHFLQVHRGLRRFVCGLCGAKYAQNQDLRRHLKASHDVDAPKIIGSDRRSADQIYVLPPLADDLPRDHPLVTKICAIVEEEEQKLNEDNLPNFTEIPQQLHLHIHKEPILNGEKVSKTNKEKDICVFSDNGNMNIKESGSDLIDSVEVIRTDGSAKMQVKSIAIKGAEKGRFVKVDLKGCREISSAAKVNEKNSEDKSSSQLQRNLILDALISTQISPDAIQLHDITSHSEQSLLLNQVFGGNHVELKAQENNPSNMTEMNIVMTKELPVEDNSKNEKTDAPERHEAKGTLSKDKTGSTEDSLIKKRKTILGDFTCCQCGKEFLDATRLERHSKIHADLKPHVCAICGKSFVEKYNLKVHMRSHTGERPYKCEVCGKSMRYLKEINDHRRMHLGEKPHVCDICSRAFLRLRDLQRHVQIHLNIKKHHCPICNKAFSRLDHLRTVHMRVHEPWRSSAAKTSEKSVKASSGGNGGANQSKNLGEKCHSNKRENFACEKCSKSFSTKAKLEKHLVLHSGHKAYKCSTCGRSFALASYLSAHQKTHEKQQAYLQCPKCPRRFVSQETLSVHEEKFHQRIEKMKKFQSSEQSFKGVRSRDSNLDMCDEERFFMTRTGEFDVNLDLEEEMSIQEVLFEPTSLSDAEKNNTFVYLHVISDDLQLTNENSLPE